MESPHSPGAVVYLRRGGDQEASRPRSPRPGDEGVVQRELRTGELLVAWRGKGVTQVTEHQVSDPQEWEKVKRFAGGYSRNDRIVMREGDVHAHPGRGGTVFGGSDTEGVLRVVWDHMDEATEVIADFVVYEKDWVAVFAGGFTLKDRVVQSRKGGTALPGTRGVVFGPVDGSQVKVLWDGKGAPDIARADDLTRAKHFMMTGLACPSFMSETKRRVEYPPPPPAEEKPRKKKNEPRGPLSPQHTLMIEAVTSMGYKKGERPEPKVPPVLPPRLHWAGRYPRQSSPPR
eukprot:Hpha_TRINITY_DN34125_c0_g1::TRINITY_DN34125_c0_g1_i1::g.75806::m.75806